MPYQLWTLAEQPQLSATAALRLVPGACAYFFATGTTTPQDTYTDADLQVPHAHPIEADSAGFFPVVYLDSSLRYRCQIKGADGTLISDTDPANDQVLPEDFEGTLTAAEIAAGLTEADIVDFDLDPGTITRYGHNTIPGTTDMSDAIAKAIAQMTAGGEPVYTPRGTHRVRTAGVLSHYATLYGDDDASEWTTDEDSSMLVCNPSGGAYRVNIRDMAFVSTYEGNDESGPSFTATTTNGSSIITSVSDTTGLWKGMRISGTGIPANSYIRYISGSTIRLGNSSGSYVNATASDSGVTMSTTYRQGATEYLLDLHDLGDGILQNLYVKGKFDDNVGCSPTNTQGIRLTRTAGQQYFINSIFHCWVDHAHVVMATSDSAIEHCHIWGIGTEFALKICAPGIRVLGCNTSNGLRAAIWITAIDGEASGKLNHNISDTNIDSGNLWADGYGIYGDNLTYTTISGCRINICQKSGIYLVDPLAVAITGNQFNNNNKDDVLFSDIEIVGVDTQPSAITVTGNVGYNVVASANKGYFIKEVNAGNTPISCSYIGNNVGGTGYATDGNYGAILTLRTDAQAAKVMGNGGAGTDTELSDSFTGTYVGYSGSPTVTVRVRRQGELVTLTIPGQSGTSTTTGFTLTGLPTAYQPLSGMVDQDFAAALTDNGTTGVGQIRVSAASGTITFLPPGTFGSWTSSGTKALIGNPTITYRRA